MSKLENSIGFHANMLAVLITTQDINENLSSLILPVLFSIFMAVYFFMGAKSDK